MLRMKPLVGHRRMIYRRVNAGKNAKRFDVEMLQGKSEDDKGRETTMSVFQRKLVNEPESYGKRKG